MLQKELDVLSERHTQKCLENSQLYQELQDEREALMQCQKENLGLHEKQVQGCRRVWDFTQHCVVPGENSHSDFFFLRPASS